MSKVATGEDFRKGKCLDLCTQGVGTANKTSCPYAQQGRKGRAGGVLRVVVPTAGLYYLQTEELPGRLLNY